MPAAQPATVISGPDTCSSQLWGNSYPVHRFGGSFDLYVIGEIKIILLISSHDIIGLKIRFPILGNVQCRAKFHVDFSETEGNFAPYCTISFTFPSTQIEGNMF